MKTALFVMCLACVTLWAGRAGAPTYMTLEFEAEIIEDPAGDRFRVYFNFQDHRTEPGVTTFTAKLSANGSVLGSYSLGIFVPINFIVKREVVLPMPGGVPIPPGTYELCITAERDPAMETACAEMTFDSKGRVIGFSEITRTSPKAKRRSLRTIR